MTHDNGSDRIGTCCSRRSSFPFARLLQLRDPTLCEPSDPAHHCLLHDDSDDWRQRLFDAAGARGLNGGRQPVHPCHPVVAPATGSRQLRLVADRRLQGSRNAHEAEARVGNDCSYAARFSRSAISCAARTPVLKASSQVPWPPTLVASPAKNRRSPDGRAGAPARAGAGPGAVCPGGRDRADNVLANVVAEDLGHAVDGGRSVFQHLLNTNAGVKTAGSAGNVEAP